MLRNLPDVLNVGNVGRQIDGMYLGIDRECFGDPMKGARGITEIGSHRKSRQVATKA